MREPPASLAALVILHTAKHIGFSIRTFEASAALSKILRSRGRMTAIQLNRYFEMIHRRVPIKVSGSIRWLRKPSSFAVRLVVAFLLILGGVFSFLPLLGIWMLPLGLMFIAQDVPFLQKPLVQSLEWVEAKLKWLKETR
jgi:hypothetical protein